MHWSILTACHNCPGQLPPLPSKERAGGKKKTYYLTSCPALDRPGVPGLWDSAPELSMLASDPLGGYPGRGKLGGGADLTPSVRKRTLAQASALTPACGLVRTDVFCGGWPPQNPRARVRGVTGFESAMFPRLKSGKPAIQHPAARTLPHLHPRAPNRDVSCFGATSVSYTHLTLPTIYSV